MDNNKVAKTWTQMSKLNHQQKKKRKKAILEDLSKSLRKILRLRKLIKNLMPSFV